MEPGDDADDQMLPDEEWNEVSSPVRIANFRFAFLTLDN